MFLVSKTVFFSSSNLALTAIKFSTNFYFRIFQYELEDFLKFDLKSKTTRI